MTPHIIEFKKTSRNNNWSYHDYRHWDLDNFFLAAKELTKKGYYVFRMGVYAEKEFKSNNPKIIDYVNSDLKSDFMDVFLGANVLFVYRPALDLMKFQIFSENQLFI